MVNKRFVHVLSTLLVLLSIASGFGYATPAATVNAATSVKVFLPIIMKPAVDQGDTFYVSPTGSRSGNGSLNKPWDLQTALSQPSSVTPGSTIYLRGGRYSGSFTSRLKGADGRPITVRAYPGERVTLDGTDRVLIINESYYVNFWDFEITNTNNRRTHTSSPGGNDGVMVDKGHTSHHLKFINLIVHDVAGMGFAFWDSAVDSEIYGCLIYNNGVNQFDHGIYAQNKEGEKRIIDNLIFDNASHGIHAYGSSSAYLDYFVVQGNTLFNNGSTGWNSSNGGYGSFTRNILVGGSRVAKNPVIDSNYTYFPTDTGTNLNLGFDAGSSNAVITNNYMMNSKFIFDGNNSGLTVNGNTVFAFQISGISTSAFSQNDWLPIPPTSVAVFLRVNQYEPRRANLTVYNWGHADTVSLAAGQMNGLQIQPGQHYELHNVQDYYNDVITGVYDGSAIQVPMNDHSVGLPTGASNRPPSTFPVFGAFVLVVTG